MTKFLKKICYFGIIVSILFGLSLYATNNFISHGSYFNIPQNISSLILGHSQSACSLNDTLIDGFYNLSENTEGYPYSYFKAKKILDNNNQIENIFIEYTNNQLDAFAINRVYGKYIDVNVPSSLPVLETDFIIQIFLKNKNPLKIIKVLSEALTSNINFILEEEPNYIERKWRPYKVPERIYKKTENEAKSFLNKNIFKLNLKEYYSLIPFFNSEKKRHIESINLKYLKKLSELCSNKGVNLYLIRSPLPSGIRFNNERLFFKILKDEFSDVVFLDFKEFPLQNDKFADQIHLNVSGQKDFSLFFEGLIEKDFLHKSNTQSFINSEMIKYIHNK